MVEFFSDEIATNVSRYRSCKGLGVLGQNSCRLRERLCRLQFALRVYDLGASFTFSLRLACYGAHHGLIEVHVLDLHICPL